VESEEARAERLRRREHDRLRRERETAEERHARFVLVCNLTQCDMLYGHADWLDAENMTEIDVQQ